jgi:hypothetical protein
MWHGIFDNQQLDSFYYYSDSQFLPPNDYLFYNPDYSAEGGVEYYAS